jgi:hypothetical protein
VLFGVLGNLSPLCDRATLDCVYLKVRDHKALTRQRTPKSPKNRPFLGESSNSRIPQEFLNRDK